MPRLFFFLPLLLTFSACKGQQETPPPPSPTKASLLVHQTFDDLAPLFEHNNDTTYVINFWATWCKPCVEELPYFEAITHAYRDQPLRVVLVSLDFPRDVDTKLKSFLEAQRIESEVQVLLDGKYNDWIDRVDPEWGGAIPVTVIYKGENRQFVNGPFANTEELDALVQTFLTK